MLNRQVKLVDTDGYQVDRITGQLPGCLARVWDTLASMFSRAATNMKDTSRRIKNAPEMFDETCGDVSIGVEGGIENRDTYADNFTGGEQASYQ
jgi:hypothetical protein